VRQWRRGERKIVLRCEVALQNRALTTVSGMFHISPVAVIEWSQKAIVPATDIGLNRL